MTAEEAGASPELIADVIGLAGTAVPAAVIATWTEAEREQALEWAAAEHLSASDNPVRRRGQPRLVARAAEIAASPVLAQLAVESWTACREETRRYGFDDADSALLGVESAAQDAVTGLIVLLGGRRREEKEHPEWQHSAIGIMWLHPEGTRETDLAAMLGSSCPPREKLAAWLEAGGGEGLLDPVFQGGETAWRLAWRLAPGQAVTR
jgi:hypothetical protein